MYPVTHQSSNQFTQLVELAFPLREDNLEVIGNVDIPVSSGAIKAVSSGVYTPGITKETY